MKTILLTLTFLSASLAMADPTWHTSKINKVYPLSDGSVVVIFTNDSPICTNGNNPKYHYFGSGMNGVTEAGFKNMYSAILAAAASGRDVTINFDSSSPECPINRLSVDFQ